MVKKTYNTTAVMFNFFYNFLAAIAISGDSGLKDVPATSEKIPSTLKPLSSNSS